MNELETTPHSRSTASHWTVLRDVLVLQFKLLCDGLRDLALSPVALVAAVMGIVSRPDAPDFYLKKVMRFGRKTDVWINLFGTFKSLGTNAKHSTDAYARQLETILLSQYEKGGLVKNMKDGTDVLIRRLQREHQTQQQREASSSPPKDPS